MKRLSTLSFILGLAVVVSIKADAQFLEDALRIAEPVQGVNARAAGIGNAFIGVADDFSALYWNPAGLGQLRRSEFSLALTNLNVRNSSTFLGVPSDGDNSSTSLNSLGMALPFPVQQGSFVIAAGYNRLANYTGALHASAFNPNSSIQPTFLDTTDEIYDLAWQLGLENNGSFGIPIFRNVIQTQTVRESGSLGQWSFGGSMEVAPNFLVGLALNIVSGSYRYDRTFEEGASQATFADSIDGIDRKVRYGFQNMSINQILTQDISGWSAKLGVLYSYRDRMRAGITIETPTSVTISERLSVDGSSLFRNSSLIGAIPDITGDYDVSTSWKYGIGISVNPISLLTVSGDVDFIDYSSITFAETSRELRAKNTDIRKYLQESALDYRLGVEGIVQGTGLTLRAGYGVSKTPFVRERGADITQVIMYGMGYESRNFAVKTMSFGLGYEVNESLALNAAFQVRKHDTFTLNYIDPDGAVPFSDFTTHESVTRTSILASICYRF